MSKTLLRPTRDRLTASDDVFSRDEVERARRYHRPRYLARLVDLAFTLAVLATLAFAPPGDALYAPLEPLPWPLRALALPALVAALSALVRLPLSFWRSYLHERLWGLSTQTLGGWLADRAKSLGVDVALTTAFLFGLAAAATAFPDWWPLLAAPAGAALVLFLSFVAPVVLEPLFNRYAPLADEQLAQELRELVERSEVPDCYVLV